MNTMHQIKHRYTNTVLFECDVPEGVQASGVATRYTLEKAVKDGADLRGAYLRGVVLTGVDLTGVVLTGAFLGGGEKLIGERPVFMTGPIGSRCDYLIAYLTDKGVRLLAGCFFGDIDTFRNKLELTHGDNDHAAEYRAALVMIEKHAEIWTQKEEA